MSYTVEHRLTAKLAAPYSAYRGNNSGILTRNGCQIKHPHTELYAKLPLTPWKPCAACFMTHFRTRESL